MTRVAARSGMPSGSVEALWLAGNPLAELPHYRTMAIAVCGAALKSIDGERVRRAEVLRARSLGKAVAEALRDGWVLATEPNTAADTDVTLEQYLFARRTGAPLPSTPSRRSRSRSRGDERRSPALHPPARPRPLHAGARRSRRRCAPQPAPALTASRSRDPSARCRDDVLSESDEGGGGGGGGSGPATPSRGAAGGGLGSAPGSARARRRSSGGTRMRGRVAESPPRAEDGAGADPAAMVQIRRLLESLTQGRDASALARELEVRLMATSGGHAPRAVPGDARAEALASSSDSARAQASGTDWSSDDGSPPRPRASPPTKAVPGAAPARRAESGGGGGGGGGAGASRGGDGEQDEKWQALRDVTGELSRKIDRLSLGRERSGSPPGGRGGRGSAPHEGARANPPPPPLLVLSGHAASLTPY